ncbi:MAG: DNA-directed RNA polymerase subunit beta' [Candidatus Yanofskybacteria bacterium RIFCSPHIGHO2_02_FULL_41_29]|uniref:DNA-directed RNA polymerase subunit beta' n=1 Tax=Candidatus Yanofskybacteria bacterium RIFCSPHIGHO2_01_FULL_41_53 TaxID=1802663 RepID=A0A1F8EMD0_9BACT|nr:MAG: DNA-directed RNA polymerase subunit beta' [Candidatus Yanofskybacteria bacterium RIFCSPHIGHO2_01_FULL_41_53]OGN12238.1 MAG: DNA-directed RNA polymerase subunit beta' [Candidatus Yanofskybacteria bacterium RIFCSPHIGHO2_02_FULL_41_29]OGN17393.1 MAG: DNA-directed RNA polymerase subunit beta' [Candidatus Yanofskybacteria bacterium RIFCSPHIGHO2_12_FULL_41_9]OGN23754.1 MAG: DNA-directed RNA polymerase subunit beta' [Candidatus Yanofskybacteria bacterium RIFCSPLOWO2_01_FULL_41_67]OGN30355.1 MA
MDLSSIKLKIASAEDILSWSYGEVTKPETINYRTQKPEKEGLFSEAIFGPIRDWECYCGKYKRIRYKGIICDRCGVEITRSIVRRERMGHIKLATPVAHIWFLRGVPSKIATVLGVSLTELEKVIYFASYVVMKVNEDLKAEAMKRIESEFKSKMKNSKSDKEQESLKELKEREKNNLKSLRKYQILSELDYRDLSVKYGEVFEAGIGAESVRKLLEGVNLEEMVIYLEGTLKNEVNPLERRKISRRLKFLKSMSRSGIRPEWMIITALPVIPPALRPMVPLDGGRYATSDLNDLYRRVINRNNRLKHLLELKAPEVITKNEKRMLQEAVDALIDNSMRRGQITTAASTGQKRALKSLADMLKGKQGRFRQNLLGKRVDYSGRSVIVIGPHLGIAECGLPKHMALELFKPFVIGILIRKELAHNIKSANRLIDQETPDVWSALEEAIKDKLVLLNRAPTLHRLSVQAFKPTLIEGKAIKIPAMPVFAFNADFDGDQMAVHLPLTDEAQKEARELMLASHGILKPATGDPVAIPSHDISFGCYYLTTILDGARGEGKIFSSRYEVLLAYENDVVNLRAKIKVPNPDAESGSRRELIETSAGRIIFNKALPEGYKFINRSLTKPDLKKLEADIWDECGEETTIEFLDKIKDVGFYYATVSGVSWGMDDLRLPADKHKIIDEADIMIEENKRLYEDGLLTEYERKSKAIEIWNQAKTKLSSLVRKQFGPNDPVFMIVDSKSRGSWSAPEQMMGMRGIFANPSGELIELPVKDSFKEGLAPLEYFISTHGARKGLVDTALRTATAGYLTRRLVDVAQDVVVTEEDCKDKEGYTLYAEDGKFSGETLGRRTRGRIVVEDLKDDEGNMVVKKGKVIEKEASHRIDELKIESIKIRSLIKCKTLRGVCRLCYGNDLSKNKLVELGEAVGIVTAQAIGEPGTQLTMRTFHTGGVAGGADITMGLPRVEEIFETRPPQFKALIADMDGKVKLVEEKSKNKIITIISSETGEEREYLISPNLVVSVSAGDMVTRGQQLSEGHVDLKELFQTTNNIDVVARYIIREVQSIYFPTGDSINDKHVELITRQMFSRVKVVDSGDTDLLIGDIIEKRRLIEENEKAKNNKKIEAQAEQLIMGISKVALSTDSFLSAASFQETAKILIESATIGKEDNMVGLKENVIIGRLIPAGTGFNRGIEE